MRASFLLCIVQQQQQPEKLCIESRSVRLLAFVALYKIRLTLFTAPGRNYKRNQSKNTYINIKRKPDGLLLHCRGKQPKGLASASTQGAVDSLRQPDNSVGPLKYQLLRAHATWRVVSSCTKTSRAFKCCLIVLRVRVRYEHKHTHTPTHTDRQHIHICTILYILA